MRLPYKFLEMMKSFDIIGFTFLFEFLGINYESSTLEIKPVFDNNFKIMLDNANVSETLDDSLKIFSL